MKSEETNGGKAPKKVRRNLCPLLTLAAGGAETRCVKARCAFWNPMHKKCSITVIGDCVGITDMTVITEEDFPEGADGE